VEQVTGQKKKIS